MDWHAATDGLSVVDATEALADDSLVKIPTASVVCCMPGMLPMKPDPDREGAFLCEYVPIAMLGWCVVHQDDDNAANDSQLPSRLLRPSAVESALMKLDEAGFKFQEK